jgi:hypothetical protein
VTTPKFKLNGWLPSYLLGFVPRRDPSKLSPHGTVTPELIEEVRNQMATSRSHADSVAKKNGISKALVWMITHGQVQVQK